MRLALVTAAFHPREALDIQHHSRSLAPALARAGVHVEVFTLGQRGGLGPLAQRRTEPIAPGGSGSGFGVTTLEVDAEVDQDAIAAAFGVFLDRERPAVCHFEELGPFGPGMVRELQQRGIPSVLCARTPWPAHDRPSMTLPDMTPMEFGDREAEARAELARERIPGLPDAGVLRTERDAFPDLARLLHEPLAQPEEAAALRRIAAKLEAVRAEERTAVTMIERRFTASRYLARELSAAIGRAFTLRLPGTDAGAVQAATPSTQGPLRALFVGSSDPVAGAMPLLEAVAALPEDPNSSPIQLTLHLTRGGDAADAALMRRAAQVGALVEWGPEARPAATLVTEADVVVIPSLWGEVAPVVPRVALAAGVPVIATRLPGMVEAVPDDAGLLVPPQDAGALREALLSLAVRGAVLQTLRAGAGRARAKGTKSIEQEAVEWIDIYRGLTAPTVPLRAHQEESEGGPVAAHDRVADELRELRTLSMAELFERTQAGIGRLRSAFGLSDTDADLVRRAVARGGPLRDRAEADANLRDEMKVAFDGLSAAKAALAEGDRARNERMEVLHRTLHATEQQLFEAQRTSSESAAAGAELEASLAESNARAEAFVRQSASARTALAETEAERDRLAAAVHEHEASLASLRLRLMAFQAPGPGPGSAPGNVPDPGVAHDAAGGSSAELMRIEGHCLSLERDIASLRRHDQWMEGESRKLVEALAAIEGEDADVSRRGGDLDRAFALLGQVRAELDWRRSEMEAARQASESIRARLVGGALAQRIQDWGTTAASLHAHSPVEGDGPSGLLVPTRQVDDEGVPRAPLPSRPKDARTLSTAGAPPDEGDVDRSERPENPGGQPPQEDPR